MSSEPLLVSYSQLVCDLQALKFEEKYESALAELTHTSLLSPAWEAPRENRQQLIQYLDSTVELINSNGRLKAKKLAALHEVSDYD